MKEIDPIALALLIEQDKVALIDVREPHEHEGFNIGGQLIPLDEIVSRAAEIPRNKTVVLYCKKGIRSQIAIQKLDKFGFENLVNLKGGMEAWKKRVK
ncbi:rhodanese-like domain-containing protein [Sediminibacterium roseum]|uniref:Rhodanese-like domain-containing protein n=1 Tax=Sediminibacterium roseum TaxID=1978412 RepID=A0ABX0A2V7_9BACT|nr:rhodanese-like domain-containing protein [Sediminibacterium roseum]NCI51545.1 rhodanese-like domain-containing protein [Sediminibacterium roseum]